MIAHRQFVKRLREVKHCDCKLCVSTFIARLQAGEAHLVYYKGEEFHCWYIRHDEIKNQK